MKIAQLTPGSGKNFYCENCQRDLAAVKALRNMGCDILMMPLYLPLQAPEDEKPANAPIFFGGINVYLQQKLSWFRKSPRWLDKLFDMPRLLAMVSNRSTMVDAKSLGETTLSILSGEDGRQVKELNRLVEWLALAENKPDAVCLSNILLAGLAREIRNRLKIPVVCFLQDEDEFVDQLPDDYRRKTWELLQNRSEDIDLFIPVSEYYKTFMQERLGQPENKFKVVSMGIDVSQYMPREQSPADLSIGYLSRMCPGKGLDLLVEAFVLLKRDRGYTGLQLKVAGGLAGEDHVFVEKLKADIRKEGFEEAVEFFPYVEGKAKHDFLRSVSVVCVPEKRPAAYGLYVLESMALGVPVVQPREGVFPELLTGEDSAGVLYSPNTVPQLADALEGLLSDREKLAETGAKARRHAEQRFDVSFSAEKLREIYQEVAGQIC